MANYQKFEEAFENDESLDGNLYELMEHFEYGDDEKPFGGKIVEDNRTDVSDSYGWTNDDLERIIYFADFDIYVKFTGNESSYQGTEWYEYKEVTPTTKTITSYE